MLNKIASIHKAFGNKVTYFLFISLFLSLLSSLIEIVGIGFLAIFAISLSDPQIILDKIPFDYIKSYLSELDNFKFIFIFAISIFFLVLVKHLISYIVFYFEKIYLSLLYLQM